jgi:hypothetical protein
MLKHRKVFPVFLSDYRTDLQNSFFDRKRKPGQRNLCRVFVKNFDCKILYRSSKLNVRLHFFNF